MTHDEMIAVIQAHKEGKVIQYFNRITERWEDCLNNLPWLLWNFGCNIYRIKPEPHYRPFASPSEIRAAIKEHGDWVCEKDVTNHYVYKIVAYNFPCRGRAEIKLGGLNAQTDNIAMFNSFVFDDDGTPFGVKED